MSRLLGELNLKTKKALEKLKIAELWSGQSYEVKISLWENASPNTWKLIYKIK